MKRTSVLLLFSCTLATIGCRQAAIQITEIPDAAAGGPGRLEKIAGKATGAGRGQRVVLFAKAGTWWVQPFSNRPFTEIKPDSTWESPTHMGTEYAALLVDASYTPPRTTDVLPAAGGGVVAVATAAGKLPDNMPEPAGKRLRFSGYEWDVLQIPSDSGGVSHINSPSNAWTDAQGSLHLQIVRQGDQWTCAELYLIRSLGYGTYSFHVQRATPLDPASVLGMFTWDDPEAGQNHREIDVEISHWGDPSIKNAQFTIQPYYVPANVFRFDSPASGVTHSFHWEPGSVSFKSVRDAAGGGGQTVAEHVFTSGIPSPGSEKVHINLYVYGKSRTPQENRVEVVLDKFEFLP